MGLTRRLATVVFITASQSTHAQVGLSMDLLDYQPYRIFVVLLIRLCRISRSAKLSERPTDSLPGHLCAALKVRCWRALEEVP